MESDPDELQIIGVYQSDVEANLVKNKLHAIGIQAFLAGEEAANMAWIYVPPPWGHQTTGRQAAMPRMPPFSWSKALA